MAVVWARVMASSGLALLLAASGAMATEVQVRLRNTLATGTAQAPAATTGTATEATASPQAVPPAGEAPSSFGTLGQFRVGIVADGNAFQTNLKLTAFTKILEGIVGQSIRVMPFRSGHTLADGLATGRVDYAIMAGNQYAFTWSLCQCIEPLAAARGEDGSLGFHSVLFTRQRDGITDLAGLQGKRLAVASEASVAARLLPFASWRAAGTEPTTHFAAIVPFSGPEAALKALAEGKVDAALSWSSLAGDPARGWSRGPLATLTAKGTLAPGDVKVVWQSPLIPNGPHVVRTTLDPVLKAQLRAALVSLQAKDMVAYEAAARGPLGGFVPVDHAFYAPLVTIFAAVTPQTPPPAAAPAPAAPGNGG
jgi:phosphate/phosphite/phosphonate ABC transporter binding protein